MKSVWVVGSCQLCSGGFVVNGERLKKPAEWSHKFCQSVVHLEAGVPNLYMTVCGLHLAKPCHMTEEEKDKLGPEVIRCPMCSHAKHVLNFANKEIEL